MLVVSFHHVCFLENLFGINFANALLNMPFLIKSYIVIYIIFHNQY
jgi:hypothetical protein